MHRIAHWLGWNGCELVEIVHGYYRHTRTPCKGFCFTSGPGPQCEWHVIIRCRGCGELQKIGP